MPRHDVTLNTFDLAIVTLTYKTVSQIRSRQLAHGDFIGRRSSRNAFIVAPLANLK